MKHYIFLSIIILLNCLTCYASLNSEQTLQDITQSSPNVILITISTLRADHVSCLGYERDTTPNFDSFGENNILFTKAFATSGWMMPAYGSIFTSLYPSIHGATHIDYTLKQEHYTLAEILNENGYYCAGFSCGPRLTEEYGFAQGFDYYDDFSVSIMIESLAFGDNISSDINTQRTNPIITDTATSWMHKNTHRPFFMFIHYYDNHWDYLPPEPYNSLYDSDYEGPIDGTLVSKEPLFSNSPNNADINHMIALYDGEIKQTDSDLGEILQVLKEQGLFENSIIIVMGDHGEQFYEHGNTSHHGLYEELVHIPLAISMPNTQMKGNVVDFLISQMDILPTILDYLQIPIPDKCQGKSFNSLINGEVKTINDYILLEYTGGAVPNMFAIRSNQYKCFQDDNGSFFAFDLLEDPEEQRKIYPDYFPEEVKELEKALREHLKSTNNMDY